MLGDSSEAIQWRVPTHSAGWPSRSGPQQVFFLKPILTLGLVAIDYAEVDRSQIYFSFNLIIENDQIWRCRVGTDDLSVGEIEQQLEALAQSRTDLEQALAQRQQQAKYDLAQEVKDLIQDRGYDAAEIATLLGARRRRSAGVKKSGSRQYTRYVDPDDPENKYVRGVLPGWMKQKMQDQGYDPSSKEDREAFKASSLQVVDD